jgi:hypothetical protein
MRYVLAFVVIFHGLIHFMGFAKAFGYGKMTQITKSISKPLGLLWLFSALLLIVTGFLFLLNNEYWWPFAFLSCLLSQILIFTVWHDAKYGSVANAIILLVAVFAFVAQDFKAKYRHDVEKLLTASSIEEGDLLTENDMVHLPEPVKKYLRYAGCVGKPKVKNFKVGFEGKLRKNKDSEWMPFSSEQYNLVENPTRLFFMKAEMKHLPVAGYHAYNNGDAFMDIRLFSLLKVQYQSGREMGIAETVTFFNDMCCMAPATLIDKRIKWITGHSETADSVQAEFTTNGITINATLYFNEKGELVNFISPDRYALQDDGTMKQFTWATPLKDYKEISGYRLGTYAEAVYKYPEGDLVYGTFTTTGIEYNCSK